MARILVVEHDPAWQRRLLHYLHGHDVSLVTTLPEALVQVQQSTWDFISLDLGTPNRHSDSLSLQMQIIRESQRTPMLILTGEVREPVPDAEITLVGKLQLAQEPALLQLLVTKALVAAGEAEVALTPPSA